MRKSTFKLGDTVAVLPHRVLASPDLPSVGVPAMIGTYNGALPDSGGKYCVVIQDDPKPILGAAWVVDVRYLRSLRG